MTLNICWAYYLLIAEIWGNFVSYLILRTVDQSSTNYTLKCGAHFLESEQLSTDDDSSVSQTTVTDTDD